MEKLAVDGGKPVFGTKTIRDYFPSWPIPYPETKEKLIEIYDSGKWGMCDKYEKMLMLFRKTKPSSKRSASHAFFDDT